MDRQQAVKWFNNLNLEEQFYKTIAANDYITGGNIRHPNSLTGREIEIVYTFDLKNEMVKRYIGTFDKPQSYYNALEIYNKVLS